MCLIHDNASNARNNDGYRALGGASPIVFIGKIGKFLSPHCETIRALTTLQRLDMPILTTNAYHVKPGLPFHASRISNYNVSLSEYLLIGSRPRLIILSNYSRRAVWRKSDTSA